MKDVFTMAECMEQLNLSKWSIQKKLKAGELEAVYRSEPHKPGRVRYITIASVARYVEKRRKGIRK